MLERIKNSQKQIIIWTLIILAATYIPLFLTGEVVEFFVNEDHLFENLTAVYFLITSGLLVYSFFKLRPIVNKKMYYVKKLALLGMAFLFFFAAGEEISWGQRIFNIQTPEQVREVNVQQEITIHNLAFFQGETATLDFSQLEMLFSLTIALGIPLVGVALKRFNIELNALIPVLPIQFGILVLVNYIYQKVLRNIVEVVPQMYLHPTMPFTEGLYEVREHGNALAIMISVFFYTLFIVRSSKTDGAVNSSEDVQDEFSSS